MNSNSHSINNNSVQREGDSHAKCPLIPGLRKTMADRSSTQHTLSLTRKECLLRSQRISFLYPWQQCQMVLNNKISGPHPLPLIWAGARTVTTERLEKMWAYHLIGWGTWLHMTKVGVLNASFASIFTMQTSFQESQFQETVEKVGTRNQEPGRCILLEDNWVQIREYINQLKMHKSMGPERIVPEALRELAGVIVMPILTI